MPDVTVSFTDAQWTRVVAASSAIKRVDEVGNVDAAYIAAKWKAMLTRWVKEYERKQASIDDF
jgi:phosphotransferase system IIA component